LGLSIEVNPSGGILQGLADLIIGYTVKDVSPTKMKYSGSGPGTVELCADPLATFMMVKMTDTSPATEVLATQFPRDAFQSRKSTLDMSGGTVLYAHHAQEDAYIKQGGPTPLKFDQQQMRQ